MRFIHIGSENDINQKKLSSFLLPYLKNMWKQNLKELK